MRSGLLRRSGLALALALGLAATPAAAAGPGDIVVTVPGPGGAEGTDGAITDAQLRWGLNAEAGGGAFAGGCNFLSAGAAGDAGGSRAWTEGDGLYRAQDANVRIEKPTAGGWVTASWATKCQGPDGSPVSVASVTSVSGNQVVIDGGTGTRRDGAVELSWSGSFTVVFYGGMTYWSVTDPRLTLDASGTGRLVATASGYGTSMDDTTTWNRLAPQTVVLADIRGADVAGTGGFTVTPQYLGVATTGGGQIARTSTNQAHWGSFPQTLIDFHRQTGQQGYWLTTGGVRDAAKPASPLTVSYSAAAPVAVPAATGGGSTAAAAVNPLRRAPAAIDPAVSAREFLAANAPITTLPQAAGLVPEASRALSPLVLPLLGSAAALGIAIIAVLSLMQALPWQGRRRAAG
ncbi:MAG: hypothetical protein BGO45_15880 [Microbacterium sp. 71-36]|uniref:hypothetical protein n=1 Tax=unclassified Microbacterium TaxID=2609290 RepID=UPI00086AFF46|nr:MULTISPECIES: hypothetical protein [unclassified Microbacterium]MBN9213151.1 hypothetical protein [Microbacterium sp.]ODT40146.1 MAG: hypothetical protein ABS60_05030 [Microbacterium sp. SCN 71-17]OJV78144.1 MAG: hypothetical protein BGO45_15880 [Microbacterium sp. 71-36]